MKYWKMSYHFLGMVVDIVVGAFKKHFEGKLTFRLSLGREVVMQI